jgi:hypothetical protein
MDVVSREPIMLSGFFRLKHSFTIAEQKNFIKKVFFGRHPLKKSQVIVTTWSQDMLVPEGSRP